MYFLYLIVLYSEESVFNVVESTPYVLTYATIELWEIGIFMLILLLPFWALNLFFYLRYSVCGMLPISVVYVLFTLACVAIFCFVYLTLAYTVRLEVRESSVNTNKIETFICTLFNDFFLLLQGKPINKDVYKNISSSLFFEIDLIISRRNY